MSRAQIINHKLTSIKIDDLKFDPSNPNKLTQEQEAGLRQSMQRWGYLTPVIVDQNNKIADGEHRALLYKSMGLKEIPAYKLNLKSDVDRRMLRQTMNKLRGQHERELDTQELRLIFEDGKLDLLSQLIAQDKDDLQRTLSKRFDDLELSFIREEERLEEEVKVSKRVKPGQVWALGNHFLMCGDNSKDLHKFIQDVKISQLNTDPPYTVDYASKNDFFRDVGKGRNHVKSQFANEDITNATDNRKLLNAVFSQLQERWAEYNTFYCWSLGFRLHELRLAMQDSGLTWGDYLVWVKNIPVLGRKDYHAMHEFCIYGWYKKHKFHSNIPRSTVLNYQKPHLNDMHPTTKPLSLIRQTITDGTQAGEIVLDPFAGSGSALIASEQTDRRCYAMEIDPHYCDVILARWEKYTGKQAVLQK